MLDVSRGVLSHVHYSLAAPADFSPMSEEILSPACVPIRVCAEPKNAQRAACQLRAAQILVRVRLAGQTCFRRCGSRCTADVLWTLRRFSPHIRRSLRGKTGARRRET